MRSISIVELQRAGITLSADEAVAVTQEVIRSCRRPTAVGRPPFGPPNAENILLDSRGTVSCPSCLATLAVSEAAILLDSLLPKGPGCVPGSLRYAVARALLDVDAPPFDSLDEFSHTLSRFQAHDSRQTILALARRTAMVTSLPDPADEGRPARPWGEERRRPTRSVSDLRRDLREADARLYGQTIAIDALSALTSPAPPPSRRWPVAAAAVAACLALLGAGVAVRDPWAPAPGTAARRPLVTARAMPPEPVPPLELPAAPLERPSPAAAPRNPGPTKMANTRASSASSERIPTAHAKVRPARRRVSLLKRMHLQWLKKLTFRSDL